jgi:hypothetical protein
MKLWKSHRSRRWKIFALRLIGVKTRFQRGVFFLKLSNSGLKLRVFKLQLSNYLFRFQFFWQHGVPLYVCFSKDVNDIFDYLNYERSDSHF